MGSISKLLLSNSPLIKFLENHASSSSPLGITKIVDTKRQELVRAKQQQSWHDLEQIAATNHQDIRDFAGSLRKAGYPCHCGSQKKASPSKGIIALISMLSPLQSAMNKRVPLVYRYWRIPTISKARMRIYCKCAKRSAYLCYAKILWLSRITFCNHALGADCILLIMACLSDAQVAELHELALKLGMSVLIECRWDRSRTRVTLARPSSKRVWR